MSKNRKKKVFFGGTFSGNSISMYISNKVVAFIYIKIKNLFSKI